MSVHREVVILATGGTIDTVYSRDGRLEIGPPAAPALLAPAGLAGSVPVASVVAKESSDLTADDREALVAHLAALADVGVVVTHGTDTMTVTAEYLLAHPDVPDSLTVVLTGAMQPAVMRDSDAPFNLGGAVIAAQTLPPGIYLVMSGRVFRAGEVTKNRAEGRFEDLRP
ncbi:MAG: asparaginase domain-containing protein [Propionicimonas sp.]|uniref:asparaginase domain-containing protein n=1 Tax=Propionicimonas sp. TaxID=1955623 RepID=UPI003D125F08